MVMSLNRCSCGCGNVIPLFTKRGKPQRFLKNHDKRITNKGRKHTKEWSEMMSQKMRGENSFWFGKTRDIETKNKISKSLTKNGTITPDGYRKVFKLFDNANHKQVMEHRKIYEEHYNICLLPYVDIHHKNNIRTDNRIENLQPLFHKEHAILHHKRRK